MEESKYGWTYKQRKFKDTSCNVLVLVLHLLLFFKKVWCVKVGAEKEAHTDAGGYLTLLNIPLEQNT